MSEVLDGTNKDPLRIFMFEMNLMYSLDEKGDPLMISHSRNR